MRNCAITTHLAWWASQRAAVRRLALAPGRVITGRTALRRHGYSAEPDCIRGTHRILAIAIRYRGLGTETRQSHSDLHSCIKKILARYCRLIPVAIGTDLRAWICHAAVRPGITTSTRALGASGKTYRRAADLIDVAVRILNHSCLTTGASRVHDDTRAYMRLTTSSIYDWRREKLSWSDAGPRFCSP
jgi:hypothetical protein